MRIVDMLEKRQGKRHVEESGVIMRSVAHITGFDFVYTRRIVSRLIEHGYLNYHPASTKFTPRVYLDNFKTA